MQILAVSSWGGACGIAEYAKQAIEAITAADPSLVFEPRVEALDPEWVLTPDSLGLYSHVPDVVWLNYHRGLHSRWTPEKIQQVQQMGRGHRIVITFHDTYGESAPDDLTQQLHDLADVFVVHEPCEGLPKQVVIRQGVPAAVPAGGMHYNFQQYLGQPILGTCGFNFPWKNFDRLAEVTADCGWAYVICSNNATDADEARWKAANPHTRVVRGFLSTPLLVSYLTGCDATCFAYECANSGTSGAIRLGLAARKPVIAWECRQFRDLWYRPGSTVWADTTIHWCRAQRPWQRPWEELKLLLQGVPIQRCDPGIVYLAERDSWIHQGQCYAQLFRSLA